MRTLYCLSLILCVCLVQADYLEERKVVYLDRTPASSGISNYLFRGNEPKVLVNKTDVVAYDLLATYMNNATKQSGFTLPESFYIIDIKFVYDPSDPLEKGDIVLESNYFQAHQKEGQFSYKVILGDAEDPTLLPNETAVEKAKNLSTWQHDDLPNYIPSIRKLLYTPRAQPTVIYLHCECGCDRTGEIAGGYAMKYLNMTYDQVNVWNHDIAGRDIFFIHQFALHWYCLYLVYVEGAPFTC
eukprot:Phypoly_transcript_16330.p1 GENE.Phypoly_transcript_16330~~Phypoly_transcript_16330.p1  ORF type:complete len:242 (+),score=28.85 Phypoly_transcript_16330:113-838(+)